MPERVVQDAQLDSDDESRERLEDTAVECEEVEVDVGYCFEGEELRDGRCKARTLAQTTTRDQLDEATETKEVPGAGYRRSLPQTNHR